MLLRKQRMASMSLNLSCYEQLFQMKIKRKINKIQDSRFRWQKIVWCSKEQMWQCQVLKIRSQKKEEYSTFYSTCSQKGLCIWEAFLLLFCIPEMFFSHKMRVRSVLIWMSGKTLKVITISFEAQTFLFFL